MGELPLENLTLEEIKIFAELRNKYLGYDSVDFLIHKTLKILNISKDEFKSREKQFELFKRSDEKIEEKNNEPIKYDSQNIFISPENITE